MSPSHNQISEFYDYDLLFEELTGEEPRSVAWRFNQRPLDNYEFPGNEVPLEEYLDKVSLERGPLFPENFEVRLDKLLLKRRSTLLGQMGTPWSLSELAAMLSWSAGPRDEDRHMGTDHAGKQISMRTYPSGGAMYSIKLYMYIRGVEGLEDGVYYYAPLQRELYRFRSALPPEELEKLFPMTLYKTDARSLALEGASILLFFMADLRYSFKKYGRLAYKLALLEAGHIAQNVQLVSTAMDKNTLPICGYFADKVEELLLLREHKYQHCVYGIVLG
jgi:SagB-type dehydrogenase family enzyme